MNKSDILKIKELVSNPKKIAIVSHRNPDGDAYGSSLALYHYLLKFNHSVSIVSPNDCPDFLKWLPKQDEILTFEENASKAAELLNNAELIFTLDFNALNRVGSAMQAVLEQVSADFIMIDHHQQPDDYAKFTYSDPSKASTCEMIYHFIKMLDDLDKIDIDTASCIYTGIVTDTGSFKYPSTTSDTHKIISHLMEIGIDHTKIHNSLFDTNSYSRLQLLGTALKNLKVITDCNTAYITISQRELNSYNFKKGDTEGFVNYGLSLKGVVFAVIFIEDQKQGIIKMSFRSKGKFSVNDFARTYFNGGGHDNAAGGRSELSLKNTVSRFLEIVPTYKQELQTSYEE
jgi:phosphoesterase RecJ-like protein